jgi:hypothetical protein
MRNSFLLLSAFALADLAFAQSISIRPYQGRFFNKATTSYDACYSHALGVAEKIQKSGVTIVSTGCREYGSHWQVIVEYSSNTYADFERFESVDATEKTCDIQMAEAQAIFDQKFPNTLHDAYCTLINPKLNQYKLTLDFKRPRGYYINTAPWAGGFTTQTQCEMSLNESTQNLAKAGYITLFKRCALYQVSNNTIPYWGYFLSGIVPVDLDFETIRGPVEESASDCAAQVGEFTHALESIGVTVASRECKESSRGIFDGIVVILEKRLSRFSEFITEQRYPDKTSCEYGKDAAISNLSPKVKVIFASCRPMVSSYTNNPGDKKWSFKIWYERQKAPVLPFGL